MRGTFAHVAVIRIDPEADIRAPGAAITVALCGHWEHEPPCPLAPHHTHADYPGPPRPALGDGELTGPGGAVTRWELVTSALRPPR